MLRACGKTMQKSGKIVQKNIKKSAKKLCKLIVQKSQLWISKTVFKTWLFKSLVFTQVLQKSSHKFRTIKSKVSYLLGRSFPTFPHRTTTTTTIFIIRNDI